MVTMPEWSEARGRTLVETCSSPVCKCSPKLDRVPLLEELDAYDLALSAGILATMCLAIRTAGEKDPVELDSSGRLKEVQASPNEWCGCIFRGPFRSSMFETRGTKRVATGKLACGSQAEHELSSDRRET
ncbi:4669_t:CDS:2, partial [Entrophospora sp. SA101]